MESMPWLQPYLDETQAKDVSEELPFKDHIVVCGYGRVGRNLVRLLQQHHLPVVVIDQSESRIQQLREAKIPYVYGNCVSLHVLETAGVNHAKGMAIALPDPMSIRVCLKRALELCPELDLVVRATQDKNIELLYQLGAREVVQPEFEASIEMATYLLTGLGLTPGVLQQEMQQIRSDHYLDFRPERSADEVSRHLQQITQDLNRRWYPLPSNSPLIGMSLGEADMRYLTGVSLMAIRRANGEEIDYPNQHTRLEQGDRLLVVGASEELAALAELAQGKIAVPGENIACQWIQIDDHAPILGKTIADLMGNSQFGVKIPAIRRDGKFMRSPDQNLDLRTSDQVLLCGNLSSLNQLQQMFMDVRGVGV
jgi:CPA2 family monovalent cation:H+ antiporter-2